MVLIERINKSTNKQNILVSAATSESESSRDGIPSVKPAHVTADTESPAELKIELENVVKLPDNLPTAIHDLITGMKKAAEHPVGKVKFFTGTVNTMLLK